jgi:HlyD family secretion protein
MKKWLALAVIVLLISVPVALRVTRGGEAKQVDFEKVSLRQLSPSILASGTLAYESEVKLVSEVIGRVQKVFVKEGDFVKQGDLLLRLDPATWNADIAQLEAALRQSQLNIERQRVNVDTTTAKWKRYQSLKDRGVVDANTYEEVAAQHELAEVELNTSREQLSQTQAQLAQSRERLAKTEFRSPIAGKVTAVYIEAGETAVPSATSIAGSDLMVVADTTSLYAEVNVDETDIARVDVGQGAKIVPAAFPDKSWTGTVEQVAISPRQNAGQSKSYSVKIQLAPRADIQFHPGMSCRAEISTRASDAAATLAVPVQAVNYEESEDKKVKTKASVFVARGETVQKRSVETGAADDAYIEIRKGVQAAEEIVTGPAKVLRFLRDGDRVIAAGKP